MQNNYREKTAILVPTSTPAAIQNNWEMIGNVALTAGSATVATIALKKLLEGIVDARMREEVRPSTAIQHDLKARTSTLNNDLVELEKSNTRLKQGSITITPKPGDGHGSVLEDTIAIKPGTFSRINLDGKYSNKDNVYYDSGSARSTSNWVNNFVFPLAENKIVAPLVQMPALALALAGTPLLAKKLVSYLSDSVLERQNHVNNYTPAAREVYENAAKELKEIKEKRKKEATLKIGSSDAVADDSISGAICEAVTGYRPSEYDGWTEGLKPGNPLTSLSVGNLLPLGASLLLAYATWNGIKGLSEGMDKAENDIAEQQHFLHGWKAQRNQRDYNYMPLYATYKEEPFSKEQKKKKNRRALELLEDIQETDGIEVNPFSIESAT